MENLVRRSVKTILFVALFLLSVRYVHTYPEQMPENQQRILFTITDKLGFRDPDDFYILAMTVLDLITTIIAYRLIVKLWRHIRTTRRTRPEETSQ